MGRQRVIRVKEGDLEGYKNIWDIFLNCKNYEVIERLARFILVVNFNFVDSFPLQARKERLEILLNRIEKHIKDGHRKANVKLMKHSLMLLNKIVVSVKGCDEQEVTDCQVKVRVRVIREGGVHFDA